MTMLFDINSEMKKRGVTGMDLQLIQSKFPSVSDNKFLLQLVDYCQSSGLDPMSGHVFAEVWAHEDGSESLRIMTTIHGYRHIAHVTGEFGGIDAPKYGKETTFNLGVYRINAPEWVEVTVYRINQGIKVGVTAREYFIENVVVDYEGNPVSFWRTRPVGQLTVRAESQALRKAFSATDSYTPDEYEFADNFKAMLENGKKGKEESEETVLEKALRLYSLSTNNDDINNASSFVESQASVIASSDYELIIQAFNEASERITATTH